MRNIHITKQRITIINIRRPAHSNLNQQLQWFGTSLGLFNLRDKDKSCFRIFIEMLKSAKQKRALSSDELAYHLGLTRGTVVHHLNKLMEAGLVISEKNKYFLRVDNLQTLISEIEKDVQLATQQLKEVAKDIDHWLGL